MRGSAKIFRIESHLFVSDVEAHSIPPSWTLPFRYLSSPAHFPSLFYFIPVAGTTSPAFAIRLSIVRSHLRSVPSVIPVYPSLIPSLGPRRRDYPSACEYSLTRSKIPKLAVLIARVQGARRPPFPASALLFPSIDLSLARLTVASGKDAYSLSR